MLFPRLGNWWPTDLPNAGSDRTLEDSRDIWHYQLDRPGHFAERATLLGSLASYGASRLNDDQEQSRLYMGLRAYTFEAKVIRKQHHQLG